jgi:MFS family permease
VSRPTAWDRYRVCVSVHNISRGSLRSSCPRFYPTVSSTQTHFVRLRSTATSIAMTGPTVGGIVFPFILEHLFARLGYAWAVRISGIVSVAGCLVALACCTSRLPPRQPKPLADLVTSLKDLKYMAFSVGCAIMCFGESAG